MSGQLISLSHAMRPGLQSVMFGWKIIELAKFCFMNKRFDTNLTRKYAMEKMRISGQHLHRKIPQLIQLLNNYGITKGLTIV